MEVVIQKIDKEKSERIIIECYKIDDKVNDIEKFVKSYGTNLEGYLDDKMVAVNLNDIFYLESVDNHVYAYMEKEIYEIRRKLYEFEDQFDTYGFFRCAKQTIINLMKIDTIKPSLGGRFEAVLKNGETVVISRKYVKEMKNKLIGGK